MITLIYRAIALLFLVFTAIDHVQRRCSVNEGERLYGNGTSFTARPDD